MPNRGLAFRDVETRCLLDLIGDVLPISQDEWEEVERRHVSVYSDLERNKETLKRKFQSLYLKKMPTGDPNCPPNVRLAKQLYQEIRQKSELSDGEAEEYEPEPDDATDNNNDHHLDTTYVDNNNIPSNAAVPININTKSTLMTTPVIRVGSRTAPPDPIDKVIKLMLIQKEADREERKLKEQARELEAEERRAELRQAREDNRTFMQMLMLNLVNNNNNNNNNRNVATNSDSFNNFDGVTNNFPPRFVNIDLPSKRVGSVISEGNNKTIVSVVDLAGTDVNEELKPRAVESKKRKQNIETDLSDDEDLLEQMEASLAMANKSPTHKRANVASSENDTIPLIEKNNNDNDDNQSILHKV